VFRPLVSGDLDANIPAKCAGFAQFAGESRTSRTPCWMMQSDANCSPQSDSQLNRGKTGNFAILGPDRDERTPKSAGSTRTFSANSLRNGTGNFKRRTGNSFGRSGNFQGRAGNLSARTLHSPARFLPETSSILRSPKRQIVVQVHSDGRCTPRDCGCARR
jgi:hypothetical protein